MKVSLKCTGIYSSPYMGKDLTCNSYCEWEGDVTLRQEELHEGTWFRQCPVCKTDLTKELR